MFYDEYNDDDPHSEPPKPSLWWRVITAFEATAEAAGQRGAEFMERVEMLFHGAVGWLMFAVSPWLWFRKDSENDMLSDMDAIAPPEEEVSETRKRIDSIRFSIADRVDAISYTVSDKVVVTADRYMPRRIFWPLYWFLDALMAVYEFSTDWWFSRDFRRLLWSLPAILLCVSLGGPALLGFLQPESRKIRHYETLMAEAEESQNLEQKVLARQKLEQLGFDHLEETDFQRAIELSRADDHQSAYEIMRKLASTDEPGFLPAHLWIAGSLLDGFVKPDGNLLAETQSHVDHALELEPENSLAKRFHVELQVRQGKISRELLSEMEALAEEQTDLHAGLAHEYRKLGDKTAAVKAARAAIRDYEKRLGSLGSVEDMTPAQRKANTLTPLGYLRISEAYMLVGDEESELRLLEESIQAFPDSVELQRISHARNVREFTSVDLQDKRAAELATAICRREPKNRDVLHRLMQGILAKKDESLTETKAKQQASAAMKIVRHLQGENLLGSEVFVFAGDFHLINNQPQAAVAFYREACKFDPKASFAWNNLASIWSTSPPLRIEHALKAANRAIELNPDPRFYDTRGQIFVKLKRWQDAINDLEIAISGTIPNAVDAHRSLIKSYEALGQSELANAHQKLMASIDAK